MGSRTLIKLYSGKTGREELESENVDTSFPKLGSSWQMSVCSVSSTAEGPDMTGPGPLVLCTQVHAKLLKEQLRTMDVTTGLTSCCGAGSCHLESFKQ